MALMITEIIITILITGGFGFISKKLDKLETKVDALENDLIRLSSNIEKRADFRRQ
jgi:hypothetical protein